MDTNLFNPVEIGKYISKQREELRLTQAELGEKIFLTRKAVSKLEVGRSVPSINTLRSLSTVFGVSIEDILQANWENSKTESKPKVFNELGSLIKKFLEALFTVHKVDRADAKKDKKRNFIFNININIGTNNNIENKTVLHDDDTNDDEDFD